MISFVADKICFDMFWKVKDCYKKLTLQKHPEKSGQVEVTKKNIKLKTKIFFMYESQ